MDVEGLRTYCRARPGASADFPFGSGVEAVRVGGKIFALISLDGSPGSVNLKCDPFLAMELRERYSSVSPGYHMNKAHWNTVSLDGGVPDTKLRAMVDHSYKLVLERLPRNRRPVTAPGAD